MWAAAVPDEWVEEARRIVEAPGEDWEPGAYPVSAAAAAQLSPLVRLRMDADAYDWFLEAFEG